MQTQMEQIIARCKETFAKAAALYGLDLSKVSIRFDLKGRAAGMAGARGNIFARTYFMRFNRDMLTREAFDHVLNETVPHEVAHIVCFMNPKLGSNHNAGWARVCRQLGGTGETRHSEEVVYGKGRTFEYVTTNGNKVRLSEQRHAMVQNGGSLKYRNNLGTVNQFCVYTIVGYQGKTLANPTMGRAPTLPAPSNTGPTRPSFAAPAPAASNLAPAFNRGESKASIARAIMLSGYKGGQTFQDIIDAIMAATGHDRNLSRAYFKNNAPKLGIPTSFYA
jgi:predicted SprT family Zn-dependent metalloprotease